MLSTKLNKKRCKKFFGHKFLLKKKFFFDYYYRRRVFVAFNLPFVTLI